MEFNVFHDGKYPRHSLFEVNYDFSWEIFLWNIF